MGSVTDIRYYGYSAGGDRAWEARPVAYSNSFTDDFERAELGEDYETQGGEWAITEVSGDKWLERVTTDPEKASGPALVTNSDELHSGFMATSGELAPLAGTASSPLTQAIVFAWVDDNEYWLGGAKCWMAIPEGEENERLHLEYFIAQNDNGSMIVHEESDAPEVLPVGTTAFMLKAEVQAGAIELKRKYGAGEWSQVLATESPWGQSGAPSSRSGFYADRAAPDAASARFDDLKIEWGTASLQVATYSYNPMHQLLSVTGLSKDATYTYDDDGNQATKTVGSDVYDFAYTFENRLQTVKKNSNTIRSYSFQGDSWMRRTAVEDGTTAHYLYDGDNLLAEYDGSVNLTAHHATSGLDRTLWTVRGGNLQTPLSSAQNVIAVADNTGSVTARYRYTAFGERFNLTGGDPARKDPSFQNRSYDSGLGLYDYRNRSFDPATGRFIQRDPKLGGHSLMNPYVFPGNDLINRLDPGGLGEPVAEEAEPVERHKIEADRILEQDMNVYVMVEGKKELIGPIVKRGFYPQWYAKRGTFSTQWKLFDAVFPEYWDRVLDAQSRKLGSTVEEGEKVEYKMIPLTDADIKELRNATEAAERAKPKAPTHFFPNKIYLTPQDPDNVDPNAPTLASAFRGRLLAVGAIIPPGGSALGRSFLEPTNVRNPNEWQPFAGSPGVPGGAAGTPAKVYPQSGNLIAARAASLFPPEAYKDPAGFWSSAIGKEGGWAPSMKDFLPRFDENIWVPQYREAASTLLLQDNNVVMGLYLRIEEATTSGKPGFSAVTKHGPIWSAQNMLRIPAYLGGSVIDIGSAKNRARLTGRAELYVEFPSRESREVLQEMTLEFVP